LKWEIENRSYFKTRRPLRKNIVENQEIKVEPETPKKNETSEQSKTSEQKLLELIEFKKKEKAMEEEKKSVGFRLSNEVHKALNNVKNQTGIDRSEAVSIAVRSLYKDYF